MDQFLIVLGIIWLAVVSPGADFAMVSRVSCIQGRNSGLLVAVGIAIACWFHVGYAIFGLVLVERWFPNLLDGIRIAGAIYLVYMGVITASADVVGSDDRAPDRDADSLRNLAKGILTNGLNPKTSLFVVSIYAQVIEPGASLVVKLAYGLLLSLSHLAWFAGVAAFLSRPIFRNRVLAHQRAINRAIGSILAMLGLLMATTV